MQLRYGLLLSQNFIDAFRSLFNSKALTISEALKVSKLAKRIEEEQKVVKDVYDKNEGALKEGSPEIVKQVNEFFNSFFEVAPLPRSILTRSILKDELKLSPAELKDELKLSPAELMQLEPLFEIEEKRRIKIMPLAAIIALIQAIISAAPDVIAGIEALIKAIESADGNPAQQAMLLDQAKAHLLALKAHADAEKAAKKA